MLVFTRLVTIVAVLSVFTGALCPAESASMPRESVLDAFDLSPAVFIENKGQWDECVRYGFDGKGLRVSFAGEGPAFQMTRVDDAGSLGGDPARRERVLAPRFTQAVFSATFVGARAVRPVGVEPSPAKMSFYRGKDTSKWRSEVPTYSKVAYKGLYEGVDLYASGRRSGLKYEFRVAPGASWEKIVIRYTGVESLSIDGSGALHVRTPLGEIVDERPVCYQESHGERRVIPSRFCIIDDTSYGFELTGEYDRSLPLVLDPALGYATFLGGAGEDRAYSIAIGAHGHAWVAGYTTSPDFPVPNGFDGSYNASYDVFVAKISPVGPIAWAT